MPKKVVLLESTPVKLRAVNDFIASAIENIIRNAIRFTPEKNQVEVTLHTKNQCAQVTVRDYGPGVPPDTIDSLFDPFFRVDETRGSENNGSGLGMAIAHSAATFHKGIITATNVHPGLQVQITIPL